MKLSRRRLLLGSASAVVLGATGYKLLRGFEDEPPQEVALSLPPSLRGTALDVHVHILGTGAGGTGCWMHDDMRGSIQVRAGLWNLGLRIAQPDLDARYVDYLLRRMHGAGFLKQVVALAMGKVPARAALSVCLVLALFTFVVLLPIQYGWFRLLGYIS